MKDKAIDEVCQTLLGSVKNSGISMTTTLTNVC